MVAFVFGAAMLALAKYRLAHMRMTQDVRVAVATPGFSAEEAERQVTEPLEQVISQMTGVDSVRSTSGQNGVLISVRATAIGLEAREPASLVRDAVSSALPRLPQALAYPTVFRVERDPSTRYWVAHSDTMSALELSRWLDQVFRRQVEVQQGVEAVTLCGDLRPQLTVAIDSLRLVAHGLHADDVVSALRLSALSLPSGKGTNLHLRYAVTSVETLASVELKDGVALRDVATLELGGVPGSCSSATDVLVAVAMFAEAGELELPAHPAVKLTRFTPLRTVSFLGSEAPLSSLSGSYPDAVATSENGTVTLRFRTEPVLHDVPGFTLRSVDEPHAIVRVSGPDLERSAEVATQARALLEKEKPRWLGLVWPQLAPERVITPQHGAGDVAQAVQLALTGVETGSLEDGTRVVVRAGTSLEDALLGDGRPLLDAVKISAEIRPLAILHFNRQRVVELEVGLDRSAVTAALRALRLPIGVTVSVAPVDLDDHLR